MKRRQITDSTRPFVSVCRLQLDGCGQRCQFDCRTRRTSTSYVFTDGAVVTQTSAVTHLVDRTCVVPRAGWIQPFYGSNYSVELRIKYSNTSQTAVLPRGREYRQGMVRIWVAGKTVWSSCYTRTMSELYRSCPAWRLVVCYNCVIVAACLQF